MNDAQPLLLFDGVCNLCNSSVSFILKHERNAKITFVPLQSEAAAEILKKFSLDPGQSGSIIFIDNNEFFLKSSAVVQISRYLKSPWKHFGLIRILPRMFSDFFYDLIAKNRYRIFGRKEKCMIPDESVRRRFLI